MHRILKRTFDEQIKNLSTKEKCTRKEAITKVYSDWSEEASWLSKIEIRLRHPSATKENIIEAKREFIINADSEQKVDFSGSENPCLKGHFTVEEQSAIKSHFTEFNKPEESPNWHKQFGYQSSAVRRVTGTRDQLLANTWNQLPLDSPLYELGPFKFFGLFSDYNGYVLPIVDPKVSIPNSLILHDFVYRDKFPDHEICPVKEEQFLKHEEYLKKGDSTYYESYQRNASKCSANINQFLNRPKAPVWSDIIKTYYYMDENWEESCGFITQKDIQDHLREHGDKRYKRLSNKDKIWTAPFQKAQKFVPMTSSLLGRAKVKPKPVKGGI
jgi:hypothetical protein